MCVNALSGCYLISTGKKGAVWLTSLILCQCPLGLLPHFYPILRLKEFKTRSVCQCPLGLLPHFYSRAWKIYVNVKSPSVNALSGCYLISTGERRFK